jgi:LDH2 family malate/lactate/ureidoglycolate dehydrogenase
MSRARDRDGAHASGAAGAAVIVSANAERELIDTTLRALGADADRAHDQALLLVEADLRGRPSHGVQRLPVIAARIRNGLISCSEPPQMAWRTPASLRVDGRSGVGPHVALRAVDALSERVTSTGLAIATVRNASHLGMLACYVERLADRGLIGIALTTSEALVHPHGGVRPLIGTNPIAIAIPTGGEPFVLDMATGAISRGEILARLHRGEALRPGVAVDRAGRPTTDPQQAVNGSISPFGGAKGYGLALAIELIVSVLSETALGQDVLGTLDTEHPVTKGDVLIAIDPSTFAARGFERRVGVYLDTLRACPASPDSDGVQVPGDRARTERRRRLRDGIPLPAALWAELQELHSDIVERSSHRA